ncbi:MAG: phosphoenolpyruvate carboxylase [Flavobacteriales bacterium]|nr:phosphoenolpyruvate carboxylase [Flavobacteriales bacterium]
MENTPYTTAVARPFEVYNSIFLTLPLDGIRGTGVQVPLFQETCRKALSSGASPRELVEAYYDQAGVAEQDKASLLFRFIQYIERQVVLVDALEDARYERLNDLQGVESLTGLLPRIQRRGLEEALQEALSEQRVRIVLTAHPTQFYPGSALGIITDLTEVVRKGDFEGARDLLHQLGLTPFFQAQAPTPYDEAVRQGWYLEHVFYPALPALVMRIAASAEADPMVVARAFDIGFWPGGDRDGNPYVDAATTLRVASRLRLMLLRCYRRELRALRRRITFKGVEGMLDAVQSQVEAALMSRDVMLDVESAIAELDAVERAVRRDYGGLHVLEIQRLRVALAMFGRHFASIDVRQDSRVLRRAAEAMGIASDDIAVLMDIQTDRSSASVEDDVERDAVEVMAAIREIQEANGERGCHRFIISNCRGASDVARLYALARTTFEGDIPLDFVPLFETVDDLAAAPTAMRQLFADPAYRAHVAQRGDRQTVMLGFSDGTKDGGYLRANWSIHEAKESVSKACAEAGVAVVFFDGRGGPPARGGGNTHRFYASLGPDVETREVQTTIQGQSISSNFGTPMSAGYNLELLFTAGLQHRLIDTEKSRWTEAQRALMGLLADRSYAEYNALKARPEFMAYLQTYGTLKYYGETNIASRPTRRKKTGPLTLDDLRAIPFVGSWSQLKQNVPGFFGIGTALEALEQEGRLEEAGDLYRDQPLFAALVENSMQSMRKCNFDLTSHLEEHPEFGDLWKTVRDEFDRTRRLLLAITGQSDLMERSPDIAASIDLRESIILPLLVIQQAALQWIDGQGQAPAEKEVLEKLVVRTMFGIVNAGRNAV